MRTLRLVATLALVAASIGLGASLRAAEDEAVQVSLFDGESAMTVPGLKTGQVLARAEAQALAGQMMQVWRRSQGEARWSAWEAEASSAGPAASEPQAPPAAAAQGDQPTKFTARDQMLWKREEKKWLDEGYKAP